MNSGIAEDLRYSVRVLLKNPLFSGAVVLSLVLGIGANCAVFTVINAVMLRPLPYPESRLLVRLFTSSLTQGGGKLGVSYPDFQDWRREAHSFQHMAAYATGGTFLSGYAEAERVGASGVTEEFFSTIGIYPFLGRPLNSADEQSGAVVIGYNLWQRRFAGQKDVLDRTLTFNGRATAIVGVMPANFDFPQGTEVWTAGVATNMPRGTRALSVIGRLRPRVGMREAQAEMATIATRLSVAYPDTDRGWQVRVVELQELSSRSVRSALLLLLGGAMILLLTASANVATLQLVRAASRSQEIELRLLLGASRSRILRQLLTEGLLLSFTGGIIGLVIAFGGIRFLLHSQILKFSAVPEVVIDFRVLGFTFIVAVSATLAFSLVSLWYRSPTSHFRNTGRTSTAGPTIRSAHAWLVGCELSLVLVLLVTAGFLLSSFSRVLHVDLGFQPEHVLSGRIANFNGAQRLDFFNRVMDRLRTLPGVQDVAASYSLPLDPRSAFWHPVFVIAEGRPLSPDQEINVAYDIVSPRYFGVLRIPFYEGRAFAETDTQESAPVAIINRNLSLELWPDGRAIGRHLSLWRDENQPREIVGIVGNIRSQSPETPAQPEVYVPLAQAVPSSVRLLLRGSGDVQKLIPGVRAAVRSIDPAWPIYEIRTMEDVYATTLAQRRSQLVLLAVFAAIALMLAALGVYGVFSYAAVSRTREIAIRMAVGADRTRVVSLMLQQAALPIAVGVSFGNAFAVVVVRVIRSSLYAVKISNASFYLYATVLLTLIAVLCTIVPALRASHTEPASVLRQE